MNGHKVETSERPGVINVFEKKTGLQDVRFEVKDRLLGHAVVIQLAQPSERFYRVLLEAGREVNDGNITSLTLRKQAAPDRLKSAEARLLIRVLSESLTINRHSFRDDFFSRYTQSVTNAEAQVASAANHVVYGRRGAGKSSLLLYALRMRDRDHLPSAWIDMQVFERRQDNGLIADILAALLDQLKLLLEVKDSQLLHKCTQEVQIMQDESDITESGIRRRLPILRSLLATLPEDLFIFLDDFHLVVRDMQPKLLGILYAIIRGSRVYLKISAIESLTRLYNVVSQEGLQVPHDAQTILLDYNLTLPEKALTHITGILDAHAKYCGLSSIRSLCTSDDVLNRLIWVSAGVPRDALNLFAQAMSKGSASTRSKVAVTDVNVAASELGSRKEAEVYADVPEASEESDLKETLASLREFCVKDQKRNAFLVEVKNEEILYGRVRKLVDLRLVHVIMESLTIGEVGRKYTAYILDYSFYTGFRAAQSVELFNKRNELVKRESLRSLPVFTGSPLKKVKAKREKS